MKKRILTSLLFILPIYLLLAITVQAATVFGPQNFTTGWWGGHSSVHTFTADSSVDGQLTVTKVTPDKGYQRGFVFLNGEFIRLRSFLLSDDLIFEKSISLREDNYLILFFLGQRDSSLSIEINQNSSVPPPEITFSANPADIISGEFSTLAWSTVNTDTVTIEPGIGSVQLNGSLDVSPSKTTEYTLIATGSGGSASVSTTVTVTVPEPTVTINAAPATIELGSSSTLSWNSTNADTCTLEPNIGSVDCNSLINVSPTETTIYTLSANGLGGTVTTSTALTVTIPEPTSTLIADPLTINLGSNSTLSWTTTNAEVITIDQGIGEVAASGSMDVDPVESTTFTLSASNAGGAATSVVTIEVVPIGITIENPVNQSSVSAQSIPVKGRIATTAPYVDVSVNNQHALVNGNDFLVPDLVLKPGENVVTVRAVDSSGNSAQAEHVVTLSGIDDWLELQLGEAGGFSPLETTLSIVPHLQKSLNWDTAILEGSGPADVGITGAGEEGYQLTFTDPGMYGLDFQIRDIDGTVYQERAFVSVLQPFTSADWQAMNEGVQQLENNFTALLATVGVESARLEVLEQAKENPDFSSAILSSGALCLVFKGLIPVILDLPDPNAPPTD